MRAFAFPLRKVREGPDTHCTGDASEIKSLGPAHILYISEYFEYSGPRPIPGNEGQSFMVIRRVMRWVVRIVAAVVAVGVVGLGMLLAFLWREHKTETALPGPTGHFAVGRTTRQPRSLPRQRSICPRPGGWSWRGT